MYNKRKWPAVLPTLEPLRTHSISKDSKMIITHICFKIDYVLAYAPNNKLAYSLDINAKPQGSIVIVGHSGPIGRQALGKLGFNSGMRL